VDESLYRFLKWTAVALACAWVGWSIYDSFVGGRAPGDLEFLEAETLFEDRAYERALRRYEDALEVTPGHLHALRGKARALLELGRFEEARAAFERAIARDPDFGATYANRGILHDRMGEYQAAIADYERALALDPELAEGPHWLTRFLRNQPEKPPTIAHRLRYLQAELAKPGPERLLSVPELDREQRSYKQ